MVSKPVSKQAIRSTLSQKEARVYSAVIHFMGIVNLRIRGGEGCKRKFRGLRTSHNKLHSFSLCVCLIQNFLEKSTERETRQEYALAMIQCKVLKQLENLEQQKYDDEDISEDIKFLLEKLGESVQDLRYVILFISHTVGTLGLV